jgi:phospho-N-acetylmuramoyl-pentapeptide-transferase
MLYYFFEFLENQYQIPGASLFTYISFRAAAAIITSLLISTIFGKRIIDFLRKKQIGESIRDLGLDGQIEKTGTPTMGGLIIIISTIIPVLLFANLKNIYIILLIVTLVWMGIIGFVDDYIKLYKKDKDGLRGKYKIIGQIILGLFVGFTLFFHPEVTVKDQSPFGIELQSADNLTEYKSTETTIPFVKDNVFNYSDLITWIDPGLESYTWIVFIFFVVLIIAAVSNGANLTDGLDGLAAGSSAIIILTLGVFTWVSGNIIFSDYLNIMYIPRVGEITIFIGAFVGALVGFLWYNTYPAQVFMGDTGSLTIGGIIAVISIAVRKEWLIPLICGIFLVENISVIMQVFYFKYTRKKYGVGKRIFLMSPLHHHFQKKGYHESKIVTRFWIVGIALAILSIITLKIR